MLNETGIEWSDKSWNPMAGCTAVSPACAYGGRWHCYARRIAVANIDNPKSPYYKVGFQPRLAPHKLLEPVENLRHERIFTSSMGDLFHESVPDDYIADIMRVMDFADWHTYVVLTKRPERMRALLGTRLAFIAHRTHIWWGVSVENNFHGIPRVDVLRECPVPVRILSIEPLLEDLKGLNLTGISWVICGGESGPDARPMRISWVQNIHQICIEAKVPFFFKQWGGEDKDHGGNVLNGRVYQECPSIRQNPVRPDKARHSFMSRMVDLYPIPLFRYRAEKWYR